jgi:FKBP-type peptidyl-prolyl cis-trans isomerase FklB
MIQPFCHLSKKFHLIAGPALLLAGVSACWAQGTPQAQPGQAPGATPAAADDATYRQQLSYMLGQNVGRDLKKNEIQCDMQSFMAGVSDALSGAQPKWTAAQMAACQSRFETEMRQKMMARMQSAAERNTKDEAAFLAQNAQAEGVQSMPSGLQFKVLKQGNGATPGLTDSVQCHYRGTLLDGTEFDSSRSRGEPTELTLGDVIPGWQAALAQMPVGSRWMVWIPPEQAYGMRGAGATIGPNETLAFDIELIEIVPAQ